MLTFPIPTARVCVSSKGIVDTAIGGQRIEEFLVNDTTINSCSNSRVDAGVWNGQLWAKMVMPFVDTTVKGWAWYVLHTINKLISTLLFFLLLRVWSTGGHDGVRRPPFCNVLSGSGARYFLYAYTCSLHIPMTRRNARYQGENNMGNQKGSAINGLGYSCEQALLVEGWRKAWSKVAGTTDPLAPFGVVTLASSGAEGADAAMGAMRIAQTAGYGVLPNPLMPNTFLAQAYDLDDPWGPAAGPCFTEWKCCGAKNGLPVPPTPPAPPAPGPPSGTANHYPAGILSARGPHRRWYPHTL